MPSSFKIAGATFRNKGEHPGWVWILTLQASMGQRAMSAKNSAEALAAKYKEVLHV